MPSQDDGPGKDGPGNGGPWTPKPPLPPDLESILRGGQIRLQKAMTGGRPPSKRRIFIALLLGIAGFGA